MIMIMISEAMGNDFPFYCLHLSDGKGVIWTMSSTWYLIQMAPTDRMEMTL